MTLAEIEQATNEMVKANNIVDGYVRPVAWRGPEQMGVAAQATKIHVAIATWQWPSYFSPEARLKGIRLTLEMGPPGAQHRAHPSQGSRPLHDLHAVEARRRGRRLRRRADARLARPGRRGAPAPTSSCDRRRAAHADARLLPRRHHPADRHRLRPRPPAQGRRAGDPADELGRAQEVFLTGTAAEITPVGEIDAHRFTPGAIPRR